MIDIIFKLNQGYEFITMKKMHKKSICLSAFFAPRRQRASLILRTDSIVFSDDLSANVGNKFLSADDELQLA